MGICFRKYIPDVCSANIEFQVVEVLETPNKSIRDKKEYRTIKLQNGLKILLISDLASSNEGAPHSPLIRSRIKSAGTKKVDGGRIQNGSIKEAVKGRESGSAKRGSKRRTISQTKYFPAASLCVGVGHLENPRELQGLMHFLEHMVFMGSQKYPKENAFANFINKCGGCDNAQTDYESTNFYFNVEESHFEEALDMFAQFFISPLLKKEAMQRERKAVHSEFQNRVDSDDCRKHQLLASLANWDHPISFFKEGNEKTLQLGTSDDELNSKMHDLRRKLYTAQFMTLAVQARETLDKLQDIVVKIFSKIPNNGLEKPTYESLGFPFTKERFHRLLKIVPVDNEHILEINWVLPPLQKFYESKPLFYIAHFLGHEGYGSILSYLKRRVWAFSLNAGQGSSGLDKNSICEMFGVTIHLTDEGFSNVKDVIKYVFEYINLLRKEKIHEGLISELHKITKIEFDHSEETSPIGNVIFSSEMMQIFPLKHIITGPSLFLKHDTSMLNEILSELNVRSCNIMFSSKKFENESLKFQTEEWFGTKYAIEEIPNEWITEWENASINTEFYLPNPNILIPDNFDVHKWNESGTNPPKEPQNILSNNAGKLWFKQDFKWNLPKAYCMAYFYLDGYRKSPEMGAMLDLFINLFNHHLMEALYEASLALYSVSISEDEWGFTVQISGFNQKLMKCLEMVLCQFEDFEKSLENKTFDAMKTQLLKSYHDYIISPDVLQSNIRFGILQEVNWPVLEKMKALENIEKNYFLSTFIKELMYDRYVNMLVQGNITTEEAKKLFEMATTNPPANLEVEQKFPKMRVRRLKAGEFVIRVKSLNAISSNSTIINYYQGEKTCLRDEVIAELLDLIMTEPLFDTLRTKEQLGYDVFCSDRNTFGILGFCLSVNFQADKYSATFVNERMETFLKTFTENLKNTSEEDLERYKESLRSIKLEEDFTLAEEVGRNWAEIIDGDNLFSHLEQHIEIIPSITLEEVCSYLQKLTSPSNNSEYRKLSVQVVGPSEPENGVLPSYESTSKKPIEEIVEFLPAAEDDLVAGLSENQFISNVNQFIDELSFFNEDEKTDL